jgi:hypothetical protein
VIPARPPAASSSFRIINCSLLLSFLNFSLGGGEVLNRALRIKGLRKIFTRDKVKNMVFFPAKRPSLIFVTCLSLSVMGTFTFAAADIPAFDFRESKPIGGSLSGLDADYTIDCINEYTVKVRRYASLPSRKSARVITITPLGTLCAGIAILFSVIKIAQPAKTPNIKNIILLKLRI